MLVGRALTLAMAHHITRRPAVTRDNPTVAVADRTVAMVDTVAAATTGSG